jgi:hypothetical protein
VTPHGDAVLRDDTTAPRARGFSYRIVSRPVTALGLALHFFHSVASQFSRRPSPSSSIPPGSGLAARSAVPPSAVRPFPYINHTPFLRKAFVRIRVSSRFHPPFLLTPSGSTASLHARLRGETQTPRRSSMLLMDSARRAGCSPVCLDLSVGLSPSSPGSGPETIADTERLDGPAAGCRVTSSLSDEQVTDRPFPRRSASLLRVVHSSLNLSVV